MCAHPIRKVFATVYIDLYEVTFKGQQIKFFTMIDSLSKWAEAVVVPDKTRYAVISALFKEWIYRYGVLEVLVSDND